MHLLLVQFNDKFNLIINTLLFINLKKILAFKSIYFISEILWWLALYNHSINLPEAIINYLISRPHLEHNDLESSN